MGRLAQLRRGAGKLPHEVPELWGLTGAERLYQDQTLTEAQAARAETASFLAVTLYALHQQSRPNQGMHSPGIELGAAVRRLMPPDKIDEPIRRRFIRVGTAGSPDVLAYRLREIISLLRRDSIPLDYALLAERLYRAQTPEGSRRSGGNGAAASTPTVRPANRTPLSLHSPRPPGQDAPPPGEATTDKDVT